MFDLRVKQYPGGQVNDCWTMWPRRVVAKSDHVGSGHVGVGLIDIVYQRSIISWHKFKSCGCFVSVCKPAGSKVAVVGSRSSGYAAQWEGRQYC